MVVRTSGSLGAWHAPKPSFVSNNHLVAHSTPRLLAMNGIPPFNQGVKKKY